MLPARPDGDLLQAGPLLVMDGRPVVDPASDAEGFRVGSQQFDSDITDGRHPRAAIGYDDMYVYSVVVDGRTHSDAGMTLTELAAYMTDDLGVTAALNLEAAVPPHWWQGVRQVHSTSSTIDGRLYAAQSRWQQEAVLGHSLQQM